MCLFYVFMVETFDLAANWYCFRVWRRESESFPPEIQTRILSPSLIILNSSMAFV